MHHKIQRLRDARQPNRLHQDKRLTVQRAQAQAHQIQDKRPHRSNRPLKAIRGVRKLTDPLHRQKEKRGQKRLSVASRSPQQPPEATRHD